MNVNTSSPGKRRVKGFTLVELLVVISIMLLVLKLLLPSLKGLMGGTAHSMARGQLIGDLNSARTLALRNGSPVYVVFMPLLNSTDIFKGTADAVDYLKVEANSMLGEQSISYAIYAEILPADQPSSPSRRWLTDWKRLPNGFYFAGEDLINIWNSAGNNNNRLYFNNLKNGHSRGNGAVDRKIYLPYLMYNSRGELSARDNPGETRVGDFYFSIREGGVLPPPMDANGAYSYENAERDDPSVAANKNQVWLQIDGLTGRANVLEKDPSVKEEHYLMWVHTFSDKKWNSVKGQYDIAPEDIVASMIKQVSIMNNNRLPHDPVVQWDSTWTKPILWASPDERGQWIYQGHLAGEPKRPPAIKNIPRRRLMALIAGLRGADSGIEVRYQLMPK